jgi:phosphatidylinositol alpha-1,6-mannosyltransferase
MFGRVSEIPGSPDEPGRAHEAAAYDAAAHDAAAHDAAAAALPGGGRPRLLLLTPDFPPARGGIQLLTYRLAAGMTAFETRVVALDAPGAEPFDAGAGVPVRRVRSAGQAGPVAVARLNARALLEVLSFRPQVTLSAHIVTSPAAAVARRLVGARTVQYFYAKEIGGRPRLAAFAARQAQAAISISRYTTGLLAAAGAPTGAVTLIPPGVDLPEDPAPEPAGRPTLITVARLADPFKGHDVVARSMRLVREQVPGAEWVVIGDGPLRSGLEELCRSEGVADCVRFLGAVSDEERDGWLRRADLLAMPSRLPGAGEAGEGFGIAYLEAGAHGKPVVAGNVGGAVDAVIDEQTGLLVDPTDHLAVAGAITRLLLDRELAARLGKAGAERARGLAWPVIAARVQALLLEQLAAGPYRGSAGHRSSERATRTAA